MGVPAPVGVSASGKSPLLRDKANAVVQGTLPAVGPGKPFAFYGSMNLLIWGSYNTALTTAAGSLAATVAAAGTIAAGNSINSVNVPPGTTVGAIAINAVTLALPTITLRGKTINGQTRITDLPSTDWLAGATVSGLGVPAGTTVASIDVTALPATNISPGRKGIVTLSAAVTAGPQNDQPTPFEFALAAGAITATGADAAAIFTGTEIHYAGTAQLERSFDGGLTWLPCNITTAGAVASWNTGTPVSQTFGEPEREILYRVNALVVTSGSINYRMSATGQAATSLSVPDTL